MKEDEEDLRTFCLYFYGRKKGSLGIWSWYYAEREAKDLDAAKLALYDEYEHISRISEGVKR